MIKPKNCKHCGGSNHTSLMCFHKARRPIKKESPKAYTHRQETRSAWFLANPPDDYGRWECYLRISETCPVYVTMETLVQEHVKPKRRYPKLKYDISNIKPACEFCNAIKGSLELEQLVKFYPKLSKYIEVRDVHTSRMGR